MIPVLVPAAAVAVEAVGGFAAAAAAAITPEVLIAGIGVGGHIVAKKAAAQAARYALGARIVPWVGGVLLAGAVLYGGYKIVKHLTNKDKDFELNFGKDGLKVKANGRPITHEEFSKTLNNEKIIEALRKFLRENARQYKMTAQDLYASTIDTIRGNPAYKNISNEDKIRLAKRLTGGLL